MTIYVCIESDYDVCNVDLVTTVRDQAKAWYAGPHGDSPSVYVWIDGQKIGHVGNFADWASHDMDDAVRPYWEGHA